MSRLIGAFAATILISFPVFAQQSEFVGPSKGDWETTISGSGALDSDFDNHAAGVSGGVGLYLEDNFLLGIRQSAYFSNVENNGDDTNFSTQLHADISFDLNRWRPFVGLNFGGFYGDDINDTLTAGIEGGVKYYADRRTFIFALTEYQFKLDSADSASDASNDGRFSYSVGIGFNF